MSARIRIVVFVAVVVVVGAAATAYALRDARRYQQQRSTPPEVSSTEPAALETGPRIVFRHTGLDSKYGLVAMVDLADPGGPRAFTDVPCDRVAAATDTASCLVTERGVTTKFRHQLYDVEWELESEIPLAGIPSRTRLSSDGGLVASTSFVSGHSYMTAGFSTATVVRAVGGESSGNLEKFTLVIDGDEVNPRDRNIWGVTFVDSRRFYATVGTGGKTYLVEGDLAERSLTSLTENAECPSVSPDGHHVAFKVDLDAGSQKLWGLAVFDPATGERTELKGGPEGVDDQVEWLDDDTLLYGLPRAEEPGVDDVWALDTTPDARPRLLIEQAWSPSVVQAPTAGGEQ